MKIGSSSGCRSTGSKKRGLDYHRRIYSILRTRYPLHLAEEKKRKTPGSDVNREWELLVEPWYKRLATPTRKAAFRQPDSVLLFPTLRTGIVIEVKLNWRDGRDVKLIDEYLPIVKQAEGLEVVWPLLITQGLWGWQGAPILGLEQIEKCQNWLPGDSTPLMLIV